MRTILVVEGLTDIAFFRELLTRLYLQDVSVETTHRPGRENIPSGLLGVLANGESVEMRFEIAGGTGGISVGVGALLGTGVHDFIVARDLDGAAPEQVVQSISDIVHSHLNVTGGGHHVADNKVNLDAGTITVMPMGLYQDNTLAELGVTQHALEDYLIKLMLEDAGLRQNAPELQALLSRILPAIRFQQGAVPIDQAHRSTRVQRCGGGAKAGSRRRHRHPPLRGGTIVSRCGAGFRSGASYIANCQDSQYGPSEIGFSDVTRTMGYP